MTGDRFRLVVRDDAPREKTEGGVGKYFAAADVVLVIVIIAVFIWYNYTYETVEAGERLVSARSGAIYAATESFVSADDGGGAGMFDFDARFSKDGIKAEQSGNTIYYADEGSYVNISAYNTVYGGIRVADVYISDISRLQTALATDAYGKGVSESPVSIAARHEAVFAITGDNYSERYGGVIMRNGVLYSREVYRDVCVLNWNGDMQLYGADEFDLTSVMDGGAYQIWSFGPILLQDGEIPKTYDTDMLEPVRRSVMGYYEPGHYCFVIFEGRVTLEYASQTMAELGCESAYALYGGTLAAMVYDGNLISTRQGVDRKCSDIIMITK